MILVAKKKNLKFLQPLQDVGIRLMEHNRARDGSFESVIRYGSAVRLESEYEINKANGILLSGNKLKSRQLFIENDIPTPKLIDPNKYNGEITIVGRPTKHTKGKGFYLIHNMDELNYAYSRGARYFSEYIKKDIEYRVHVAHGKVLLVQSKEPMREEYKQLPVWNWATGHFVFRVVRWSQIPKGLLPLAVSVTEKLELDFAAIDIMAKDGKFYVLESNTAPRLTGYTLSKYMKYFEWLKNNPERQHFTNVKKYIIREAELE